LGAGWDLLTLIREQGFFTKGLVVVQGKKVKRRKAKFADYPFFSRPNVTLDRHSGKVEKPHPRGGWTARTVRRVMLRAGLANVAPFFR
jgi:hypothetical protein